MTRLHRRARPALLQHLVTPVRLLASVASLALAGTLSIAHAAPASDTTHHTPVRPGAQATPNIVFLLMDDLDLSVWQNALDRDLLPRIQSEIVDHGTTFDNLFVAESSCCPSRTTMLTGRYPHNHGVLRTKDGPDGGFTTFTADGSTIATWMHAAGYRTGLMGKYLNGYGRSPRDSGGTYIPPGWDAWWGLFGVEQYNYYVNDDGTKVQHAAAPSDYQTDALSAKAKDFLASTDPRPFMLVLTPTAPHYEGGGDNADDSGAYVRAAPRYKATPRLETIPPESLASFNEADMSDKPVWMRSLATIDPTGQRSGYNDKVAAIRAVDDLLGMVVDTLRANGRYDDTLVIVTSDNGFQYATHRRLQKTDFYEESARVPMVIHAPGQTTHRHVTDWVVNVDWAATFVDAGHATPDVVMDGQSLMPWILGGTGTKRRSVLIEYPPAAGGGHRPFWALRSKDPAITGDESGATTLVYAETLNSQGIITDKEFYDLSVDPLQLQSMQQTTDPARKVQMKSMQTRLHGLETCVGTACVAQ